MEKTYIGFKNKKEYDAIINTLKKERPELKFKSSVLEYDKNEKCICVGENVLYEKPLLNSSWVYCLPNHTDYSRIITLDDYRFLMKVNKLIPNLEYNIGEKIKNEIIDDMIDAFDNNPRSFIDGDKVKLRKVINKRFDKIHTHWWKSNK